MLINPLFMGAGVAPQEVFSADYWAGTQAARQIINGLNFNAAGGLAWIKWRAGAYAASNDAVFDTVRGAGKRLSFNAAGQQVTTSTELTAFNSSGFSLGGAAAVNGSSSAAYMGYSFLQHPDFFGIVQYVGNGVSGRKIDISHLGFSGPPGLVLCKRIDGTANWCAQHIGRQGRQLMITADPDAAGGPYWAAVNATRDEITLGSDVFINSNGVSYICYVFGHNPTPSGIIACGTYTGNAQAHGPLANVGGPVQAVIIKASTINGHWQILDAYRSSSDNPFTAVNSMSSGYPENSLAKQIASTPDGFQVVSNAGIINASGVIYQYIAIRAPF